MRWHWDIYGSEPIIRDEPVFDAQGVAGISSGTMNAGALMQMLINTNQGTDPDIAGPEGICLVPAYDGTASSCGYRVVGVMLEQPYTTGTSSAWSSTTGPYYGKCIINPGAIYLAEADLSTSASVTLNVTATTTTAVSVPGTPEDLDGYWLYFTTATAGVKGCLRLITAWAGTAATIGITTVGTVVSGDRVVLIQPKHKMVYGLDPTARNVRADCTMTGGSSYLRVVETFIDRDAGLEIMKPNVHNGLNYLNNVKGGNGPKFFYDLAMLNHLYACKWA